MTAAEFRAHLREVLAVLRETARDVERVRDALADRDQRRERDCIGEGRATVSGSS